MKYLTEQELLELSSELAMTPNEVKSHVLQAEKLVNIYTRRFYYHNDFETDNRFRKEAVKDAIKEQVRYIIFNNITILEEINDVPQALTIGRTTINNSSKYNNSGKNISKPIACLGFMDALSATGLLFRGV
jgi:hypothetical protein|nr:MAG TPA: Head Tail Connector Protein [Caudoviricetes sp.]